MQKSSKTINEHQNMEISPNDTPITKRHSFQSSVDTSRPFRSVKEAVAVFGERILVGSAYISPARADSFSWRNNNNNNNSDNDKFSTPCSPATRETTPKPGNDSVAEALKRVEAELEETKAELKTLKEREQETEVAVAALNAELHQSMSRLAAAEAAAAARTIGAIEARREEEKRRELRKRMEKNTTLAQILSLGLGENDMNMSDHFARKSRNKTKKVKPIVPLVGDIFSSLKKGSRSNSPLYSAPAQLFH